MSDEETPAEPGTDPLAHVDTGKVPKRINVAVNPEEVGALERMILVEQVSLTEAVRRLLMIGDFIHKAIVDEGVRLVAHKADGTTGDVVLLGEGGQPHPRTVS